MKCVILAGGYGTRITEESAIRPKPLVEIGGKPILQHIMQIYAKHNITDFIILTGYKGHMIEEWVATAGLSRWNIDIIDTGEGTLTGGRLLQVRPLIDSTFCLTYGDGVSDVNIDKTISEHKAAGYLATITAVQQPDRFGVLELQGDAVIAIREKHHDWINGGFFVLEPAVFNFIPGNVPWETVPLEALIRAGQLRCELHRGFWQCMDTLREKQILDKLIIEGNAPWI